MKLRIAAGALVLAVLSVASWWWFSPWWVLHQVRSAAERNDAEAISDVIDYPRLRDSLKGEFNSALAGRIRDGAAGLGESGRAGAALGAVLASALVDKVVDMMVRPEFVIRAVRDGQLVLPGRAGAERGAGAGGSTAGAPAPQSPGASGGSGGATKPGASDGGERRFQWRPERVSADRLIVWVSRADAGAGSEFGLVFERSGFAAWKLAAARLPAGLAGSR